MRPASYHRVDITDPREVEFWCKELKCTPEHLKMAVQSKGVMLGAVRKALAEFKAIYNGDLRSKT